MDEKKLEKYKNLWKIGDGGGGGAGGGMVPDHFFVCLPKNLWLLDRISWFQTLNFLISVQHLLV